MSPENLAALLEVAPRLYVDYGKPDTETCITEMGSIGDGWWRPLYALSFALEALIRVEPEEQCHYYRAFQVKQKFGGLRFYMASACTPPMGCLIEYTEKQCAGLCETCGKPGELAASRYMKTLCPEHAPAHVAKYPPL